MSVAGDAVLYVGHRGKLRAATVVTPHPDGSADLDVFPVGGGTPRRYLRVAHHPSGTHAMTWFTRAEHVTTAARSSYVTSRSRHPATPHQRATGPKVAAPLTHVKRARLDDLPVTSERKRRA